jgi:hypothetical protein
MGFDLVHGSPWCMFGSLYELEQIIVGFNEGPFKLTRHKYKITMMHNSRWSKIQNDVKIPLNSFDFESFASILASTVEEKIVGNVVCCECNHFLYSFVQCFHTYDLFVLD